MAKLSYVVFLLGISENYNYVNVTPPPLPKPTKSSPKRFWGYGINEIVCIMNSKWF